MHGVLWKGLSTSLMVEQLSGKQPLPRQTWTLHPAHASWVGEQSGGINGLTVELIIQLNKRFSTGNFRYTCQTRLLSGKRFRFANSTLEKLRDALRHLLERLKAELGGCSGLAEQFKVAAEFTSRFLLLHPFGDGNGRTVEVILAVLLHEPIGYYMRFRDATRQAQRCIMLRCLEQERIGNDRVMAPRLLCSYIIQAAWVSHHQEVLSLQMLVESAIRLDAEDHDQGQRLFDAVAKSEFTGKEKAVQEWNKVHCPEFNGTLPWKCSKDLVN